MGFRKYHTLFIMVLFTALVISEACFAEMPEIKEENIEVEAPDMEENGDVSEKEIREEIADSEATLDEEALVEYEKGLLDEVLSRGKIAAETKSVEPKYETFDEKLRKEKKKQRIEDIGKGRKRDSERRIIEIPY